ncbi:MAG: nucleotidyl transferase AbiEii/AbiGii toxin family protein [Patescibacteria group bacterium]|jgi:predicted nucleotidyltransferase component of viral defense system
MQLLGRRELEAINRTSLRYPLAVAEKDYFLALVSKIIYESPLRDKLIFKGGTALHHTYLPQLRFSEDLDFSSNTVPLILNEVKAIFADYDFLSIKKDYVSKATIKVERLQFIGPLNQANSMKVEIDFLQNVVLPPLEIKYHNVYGVDTLVRVMDIREIAAEKIRAMNDRIRYRDFYDFTMICLKLKIALTEIIDLLQQKEVRKPISPQNILSNWQLVQANKQNELAAIHYSESLIDNSIEKCLQQLIFAEILPQK